MPIDQAARHCGVSIGMLSKLENGKGGQSRARPTCDDGLGLTILVVPKAHARWLEQAAAHAAKIGEDAAREQHTWLEE
ncbi:transcriptional regulator [Cupriavidus necator]|uniref:transcriptional regulator n=1 Tax=Cupriavidus necator TaxID=106590 RepID=UPI0009B89B76|nr:transcriptional regulator [Cupriavidus necator]